MHPIDIGNGQYLTLARGSNKSPWNTCFQYLDCLFSPNIDEVNTEAIKLIDVNIDSLIDGYRCAATLYDGTDIVNQTLEQEAQDFEEFMREFW